jgi:hypothetical protein
MGPNGGYGLARRSTAAGFLIGCDLMEEIADFGEFIGGDYEVKLS